MIPRYSIGLVSVFYSILVQWISIVSSLALPLVDPGLFVIQGVSTCGLGVGYCLLSNSCLVDTDFESDTNGGHCDGLKHAFNPNADFVCCQYIPPVTTDGGKSSSIETNIIEIVVETEGDPPEIDSSNTNKANVQHLLLSTQEVADVESDATTTTVSSTTTTTTTTTAQTVTPKKTMSPFNIVANTNKILNGIQHLLQGGRMRPSVVLQKYGHNQAAEVNNDKSLVNLIMLGFNSTTVN